MVEDKLLIVFAKNLVLGKVKTRLAQKIGDERALFVYEQLLRHTLKISKKTSSDKAVYYSDCIETNIVKVDKTFGMFLQVGATLGERMANAFRNSFSKGYKNVILIGSDCLEINESILNQAFEALKDNEMVIGPAVDGGYYLIGMKQLYIPVFRNKLWSTSSVLADTFNDILRLNLSLKLLPTLSDIDTEKDLEKSGLTLSELKPTL